MKLQDLLNEELVVLHRDVPTKAAAITLLLKEIFARYPLKLDPKDVEKAVFARESLGGTSFPSGMAIPHARLDGLDDLILAVLVPKTPIPDPAAPIQALVLMLTSQAKPTLYLNTLGALLKFSQNHTLFEHMVKASHPSAVLDLVRQADYTVKKDVLVEDIMTKPAVTVRPDTDTRTLADLFYTHNYSYCPVIDHNDEIVGEVSLMDLLKAGYPDHALMTGSLKFSPTFEPFEGLLAHESSRLVRDIMRPLSFSCAPSAAVVEIAFELLQKKRRHLVVLQGKTVVGVLSIMDLLKKVIRG